MTVKAGRERSERTEGERGTTVLSCSFSASLCYCPLVYSLITRAVQKTKIILT